MWRREADFSVYERTGCGYFPCRVTGRSNGDSLGRSRLLALIIREFQGFSRQFEDWQAHRQRYNTYVQHESEIACMRAGGRDASKGPEPAGRRSNRTMAAPSEPGGYSHLEFQWFGEGRPSVMLQLFVSVLVRIMSQ